MQRNFHVNAVSHGPINTPFTAVAALDWKDGMIAALPLGRCGQPRKVATAALFLASSDSSYITGADICIGGGLTAV